MEVERRKESHGWSMVAEGFSVAANSKPVYFEDEEGGRKC